MWLATCLCVRLMSVPHPCYDGGVRSVHVAFHAVDNHDCFMVCRVTFRVPAVPMPYIIDDSLYLMLLMSHLCDFPMNRPTRFWQVTLWKWPNLSGSLPFRTRKLLAQKVINVIFGKKGPTLYGGLFLVVSYEKTPVPQGPRVSALCVKHPFFFAYPRSAWPWNRGMICSATPEVCKCSCLNPQHTQLKHGGDCNLTQPNILVGEFQLFG